MGSGAAAGLLVASGRACEAGRRGRRMLRLARASRPAPDGGKAVSPSLVAVGSTNPTKVEAVRAVIALRFPDARVSALPVDSGVSPQPLSLAETTLGAVRRAEAACRLAGADWGFGLEGGVDFDPGGWAWLCGVVAVSDRGGRTVHARAPMLPLPPAIAACLRAGEELGPVMDRLTGRAHTKTREGAIGVLTDGLVPRTHSWRLTVACALAPLLCPDLYGTPPPARA